MPESQLLQSDKLRVSVNPKQSHGRWGRQGLGRDALNIPRLSGEIFACLPVCARQGVFVCVCLNTVLLTFPFLLSSVCYNYFQLQG